MKTKFRAWHKEEKIMCEVSLINFEKGVFLIGVKPGKDQIQDKYFVPAPKDGRFCEWDEIELLQFIGLTDLKGVEIFKGDRVFDPHGNPGECELFTVRYNDEMARFDLVGEGEAEWDETDWQVYDNIHEQKPTSEIKEY